MPSIRIELPAADLRPGLHAIRREFKVPEAFPAPAAAEAAAAASRPVPASGDRRDARDLALLTIDPPGSRDLDQAFGASRRDDGYRVHYAIADVAAFVRPDGAVDREAWERGQTVYLPDRKAPLHPEVVSEGAASLLPRTDRPALLWTMDVDGAGAVERSWLERAVVRSDRALSYAEAQAELDGEVAGEALRLLRDIGRLREEIERERGGISLNLPTRKLVPVRGGFAFSSEAVLPLEGWNAQVSLLAGHCAARIMVDGGVGILRTLPPLSEETLRRVRLSAAALGIVWPDGASLGEMVRTQDGSTAVSAAFLTQATRALRGASYAVVNGEAALHGGLGMLYAHVTAPLRRLVDRYANEVVLALCAGREVPSWASDALPLLPATMEEADRRADGVEGAVLNLAESLVLAPHVGRTFTATVIDAGPDRVTVQLRDPPVVEKIAATDLALGDRVELRLAAADPLERRVRFERA